MNGILIFSGRLYRRLFVALFTGNFFALKTQLTSLKAGFCLCGTLIFKANFVYLGLFLAEILHQRNAAWAYPGAGPAFDAVGQIMRGRFVVLLAFTEPVQLLRQKIGRAGISAGATANAAFFLFRLTHLGRRWRQQTVGDFDHRNVQPGQGKAH